MLVLQYYVGGSCCGCCWSAPAAGCGWRLLLVTSRSLSLSMNYGYFYSPDSLVNNLVTIGRSTTRSTTSFYTNMHPGRDQNPESSIPLPTPATTLRRRAKRGKLARRHKQVRGKLARRRFQMRQIGIQYVRMR
jgi:hypothetical protein